MISILLKRVASLYLQNKTIKSQISTKNSEATLKKGIKNKLRQT